MDDSPFDPDFYEDYNAILEMARKVNRGNLVGKNNEWIEESVDDLLKAEGITLDKSSMVYRLFCRQMFKAEDYIMSIQQKRHRGDYDQDPGWTPESTVVNTLSTPAPKQIRTQQSTEVPTAPERTRSLTEIRDLFFEEGKAEGRWNREKTMNEVWASQQVLIDYFGDVPINSLDRQMMAQFKRDLWKLPPNMNKVKAYRDLTIHQILKLDLPQEKCIKELTVSKYLSRANSLFEYARINGEIHLNPMEGMTVKKTQKADERREIWDKPELERIFGAPGYTNDSFNRSYQYWTPLLAIFTGARQEEICNLRLSDFEEHEGIWCLNILADDGKDLKNKQSHRLIPLHPTLIELGILRRYEHLKSRGQNRFMPDLKAKDGRYGPYVSRWFNERFKVDLGFPTGEGKDFHSFRHTFGTNLAHHNINDHHLKALMGHSEGSITFNTYIKRGFPPELYKSLTDCLNYGINLDHLKGSQWELTYYS